MLDFSSGMRNNVVMFQVVKLDRGCAAKRFDISKGDTVVSVNGSPLKDILDWEYFDGAEEFTLLLAGVDGAERTVEVKKEPWETMGITFDDSTYRMEKACGNKCVFCFVDQLPKNLRRTLYFKDDDWRLSFVSGNYVTFTNISDAEIERICEKKFSPLYVSVHATDDSVRRKMLQNPKARALLPLMKTFAENGITMNTQIVLCPDYNDGAVLKQTVEDLFALYPGVQSLAVVPVGLTKHRDKLTEIRPINADDAKKAVEFTEAFAKKAFEKTGNPFVFCSDEIYLKAGLPVPAYEFYGDFSQIENGVGMLAKFRKEFEDALQTAVKPKRGSFTVITGVSACGFITELTDMAVKKFPSLSCNVQCVKNGFFGDSVTVSGLITAQDILQQADIANLGKTVLIPKTMLKEFETVFLDGTAVKDLSKALKRKVVPVPVDGFMLCNELFEGIEQ